MEALINENEMFVIAKDWDLEHMTKINHQSLSINAPSTPPPIKNIIKMYKIRIIGKPQKIWRWNQAWVRNYTL